MSMYINKAGARRLDWRLPLKLCCKEITFNYNARHVLARSTGCRTVGQAQIELINICSISFG